MATNSIQKKLKKEENKTFTARDFETLRSQLLDTARTYFPDKIQDFSEPSGRKIFMLLLIFFLKIYFNRLSVKA